MTASRREAVTHLTHKGFYLLAKDRLDGSGTSYGWQCDQCGECIVFGWSHDMIQEQLGKQLDERRRQDELRWAQDRKYTNLASWVSAVR